MQQYDDKSHPVNPSSTSLNKAQIQAKNEVLEAVGVCERKNKDSHDERSGRASLTTEQHAALTDDENEIGGDYYLVAEVSRLAGTWWIGTIQKKIQAGLHKANRPFMIILSREWNHVFSEGVLHALRCFSAGVPSQAMTDLAISTAEDTFYTIHRDLGDRIHMSFEGPSKRVLLRSIDHLKYTAMTFFQIGISPLPLFSILQQLGLYSSHYGVPPPASFLPWHESSPLQWAWSSGNEHSLFSHRLFHLMTSPLSLWLSYNALRYWVEMNGNLFDVEEPNLPTDLLLDSDEEEGDETISSIFVPWSLRPVFNLYPRSINRSHHLTNAHHNTNTQHTTTTTRTQRPKGYRLSVLSTLPSKLLSECLQNTLTHLVLLPLSSLLYRSVTYSFLHSPYAQTLARQNNTKTTVLDPLALASHFSPPLQAGSLVRLLRGQAGVRDVGDYASKVGLCVALQVVVDVAIWGVTWFAARRVGLARFYWGCA